MAEIRLEDAPETIRAFYDKGMDAMKRSNLDYAMDMFEAALEIEPRILQIRRLFKAAAIQKNKSTSGNTLASIGSSLKGRMVRAKLSAKKKKAPVETLAEAEKLLREDPFNLHITTAMCDAAIEADMPEVAIQTWEMLREQKPNELAILEPLANLYRDAEQFKKEYECRRKINQLKPNDAAAQKLLNDAAAHNTMDAAGWDKAESYRDVAKDSETKKDQTTGSVTEQNSITDQLAKIEKEPNNVNYRRALADLYLNAKQFDQATEALEICAKMSGNSDPRIDQAITEVKISKFNSQIAEAKEAGNDQQADELAKDLHLFRLKDTGERVKRYPNDLQFKYDYGIQLFAHENYTEAIQMFQQAQRNPQRRTNALYYLALCFKKKGQLDIAAEQLEKALSELSTMDKNKMDVLYELGSTREKMGDKTAALQLYKQIYSADIGYRDIATKVDSAYTG